MGKKLIAHHVFFWLKNPDSTEDRDQLINGLRTLEKIESVRGLHIGIPADVAPRPVVESGYSVSELIFFDDIAGHDAYQVHPIHQEFIANHSHLWEKVVIYDAVDV